MKRFSFKIRVARGNVNGSRLDSRSGRLEVLSTEGGSKLKASSLDTA